MNILIVSEKPSVSRALAPTARAHWPTDGITIVHANPYDNIKFNYPHAMRMPAIPIVSQPKNRLNSWDTWHCPPVVLAADGTLVPVEMTKELFTNADVIIHAGSPDHTGAVAFYVLLEQVFGDSRALECPVLMLSSLDALTVVGTPEQVQQVCQTAINEMQPFSRSCATRFEFGMMKRYFDWNWNVNSLSILGEAQHRAGVSADVPPVSKYALQLLYALQAEPPLTDAQIVNLMQHWSGTGRYGYKADDSRSSLGASAWRPSLGSHRSAWRILENLETAGLLERAILDINGPVRPQERGQTVLSLSACGRNLLAKLHPECKDLDLPFRIDAWCDKGLASKRAIDRYIKDFFGKQLRFASQDVQREQPNESL